MRKPNREDAEICAFCAGHAVLLLRVPLLTCTFFYPTQFTRPPQDFALACAIVAVAGQASVDLITTKVGPVILLLNRFRPHSGY